MILIYEETNVKSSGLEQSKKDVAGSRYWSANLLIFSCVHPLRGKTKPPLFERGLSRVPAHLAFLLAGQNRTHGANHRAELIWIHSLQSPSLPASSSQAAAAFGVDVTCTATRTSPDRHEALS
jgi:hypothetical protein